jgi:xylulokinase
VPAAAEAGGAALVVDVGTGAVKVGVLDPEGTVLASAEAPLTMHTAPGGVMEQDAEEWWRAASRAVRELVDRGATASLRGVVLTGQMQDLTLADDAGRPLRATLLYGDVRAMDEADAVAATLGGAWLQDTTGNAQDAGGLLAKLLWLQRHEPQTVRRARRIFLGAADAIAYRLTGDAACDTTTASTTGLMQLDTRAPLPAESFEALGLGLVPARMPRLVPGGALVGELGPSAASRWRLPAGLPVSIAPGDAGAATVGAGSGEIGVASGYLGTSGWVSFSAERRGDPEAGVFTLAHPRPGHTIQIAPLLTAGGNLTWAATAIADDADYERLIGAALARPPARLLYLPYLQGERSPFRDPFARGAFIGLELATTREDLVRAVLEGVCLAFRHVVEALAPPTSGDRSDLILSGGGTRSEAWCRLFASVLGRSVVVPDAPEAVGLRGALRCVQVAQGTAGDYRVEVRGRRFEPDPEVTPAYDRQFELFRGAHRQVRGLVQGLLER